MSIKKTLLMLFINYILIIVWLMLFRMGVLSALVMLPLTILAITLNYLLLDGKKEVSFWCMNLLGATTVGIGLSTYMYARYINPAGVTYVYMIMEMLTFAAIIFISSMVAGRMNAKRVRHARPKRVKHRRVYQDADVNDSDLAHEGYAGRMAQGLADRYIEEAQEEAFSQQEDTGAERESKFRMVVKGKEQ